MDYLLGAVSPVDLESLKSISPSMQHHKMMYYMTKVIFFFPLVFYFFPFIINVSMVTCLFFHVFVFSDYGLDGSLYPEVQDE